MESTEYQEIDGAAANTTKARESGIVVCGWAISIVSGLREWTVFDLNIVTGYGNMEIP